MKTNPKPYEWDWHGQFEPHRKRNRYWNMETFSVGCFQWIPEKLIGLKRGPVAKRFRGRTSDPQAVYAKAQAWCDERNAEAAAR